MVMKCNVMQYDQNNDQQWNAKETHEQERYKSVIVSVLNIFIHDLFLEILSVNKSDLNQLC